MKRTRSRCPRCEGEGVLWVGEDEEGNDIELTVNEAYDIAFNGRLEDYALHEETCPDCDGTGQVTEEYFNFDGI